MVADTVEGARWLLGQPAVVLLVDGYNVAKTAWPDAGLEEQRTAPHPGAGRAGGPHRMPPPSSSSTAPAIPPRPAARAPPRWACATAAASWPTTWSWTSSPPIPPDRPVVVVSNDREVRDGARTAGANVIGSTTLISVFSG